MLFVDDTNIFCSEVNIRELLDEIIKEMKRLKMWFDRNKLSLNINRTKITLFGNCRSDKQSAPCVPENK